MLTTMPQKIWLIIPTAIFGFTVLSLSKIAVAQSESETLPNTLGRPNRTIQSGTRVRLRLPPSLGVPGRRIPAASRGINCIAKNQRLTALIPKSNIGLTTLANPTLYFFIPQNSASRIELVVQDENEQIIYQQKYKPSTKAGVVGIDLPPDSLAMNKKYRWNFSIICNPQDRSSDKLVQGTIQRVKNPSLTEKLEQATPQERVLLYAEAGSWHDALDTLARLRYSNPHDLKLKADWEALLTAPGVEFDKKLAQKPLISEQEAPRPLKRHKLGLKDSVVKQLIKISQ
ncbi:DUF928 domain-containing protein [Fortiea sp. LEGE XX443]|uniref:DUF928 domain-containing protein n=1 Tax=Fortiea sp. LEGE XX443 TaxID=1828611 RepID=UPI00187F79AA|nr:DUF928 domain-containing protein [Fortiea sp. LEGE XX443]MBE9007821.1 DUF928 domain-containing protein [Fortiea sp. LEGE XX443]